MKKKIIFLGVILSIFSSCETYKRTAFEYHFGKDENEWINMYKTQFFLTCLRKGYKDDVIFRLISQKDLLVPYETIMFQYVKIDTLSTRLIKNIPKPVYPHCDDCTEEEEKENLKKNYICASCLNYYASKELDSIANHEYKKYLKGEKRSVLSN